VSLGLVFLRHFDTAGSGRNPGEKYKYKYVTSAGTLDQTLATSWKSSMRIFERVPWRYEGDYVPPELKFQINTDKFAPGTYKYELISLDLIKLKLDLMSRYPYQVDIPSINTPFYESIENNLNLEDVYDQNPNRRFHLFILQNGVYVWDRSIPSPPLIVKAGDFNSGDSLSDITIEDRNNNGDIRDDMIFVREDTNENVKLLDFVLVIKPK